MDRKERTELFSHRNWLAHCESGRLNAQIESIRQTSGDTTEDSARIKLLALLTNGQGGNETDNLRWWNWLHAIDAGERPEPPTDCGTSEMRSLARLLLESLPEEPKAATTEPPSEPKASSKAEPVEYDGNGIIRFLNGDTIKLNFTEQKVLEKLLQCGGTAKKRDLQTASDSPHKVLKQIQKKDSRLESCFRFPGNQRIGYSTSIVDARKPTTK